MGIVGELVVITWEFRDDREAWRRGIIRLPDRPSLGRFWVDVIATVLVVVGVFGEAGASMELASINSHLRSKTSELRAKTDQLLALVTQEAGDAAQSATTAREEIDAIGKVADALGLRLTAVNQRVEAESPRELVLGDDEKNLIKKLSPFSGQRFALMTCGVLPSADPERSEENGVMGALDYILKSGAKWTLQIPPQGHFISPHTDTWEKCMNFSLGVHVFVGVKASHATTKAAKVLSSELSKVLLPPQLTPVLQVVNPTGFALRTLRDPIDREYAVPQFIVFNDPGMIVVLVGGQPIPSADFAIQPKTTNKSPN